MRLTLRSTEGEYFFPSREKVEWRRRSILVRLASAVQSVIKLRLPAFSQGEEFDRAASRLLLHAAPLGRRLRRRQHRRRRLRLQAESLRGLAAPRESETSHDLRQLQPRDDTARDCPRHPRCHAVNPTLQPYLFSQRREVNMITMPALVQLSFPSKHACRHGLKYDYQVL